MVFSNANFKDGVKEHELEKFLNILSSVNLKFQSSFMSQLHQTTLRIDVHSHHICMQLVPQNQYILKRYIPTHEKLWVHLLHSQKQQCQDERVGQVPALLKIH